MMTAINGRYRQNIAWRDRVVTRAARSLSNSKALWYLETVVYAARFAQFKQAHDWAAAPLFDTREDLWASVASRVKGGSCSVLEFGVANGAATRWWISRLGEDLSEIHGFDTFVGLPSPWRRAGVDVMAAGVFSLGDEGARPLVPNGAPVTWHEGMIEETLPRFPGRCKSDRMLVLVDVDLYEPALHITDWFLVNAKPGDILYFDEAFDPFNEGLVLSQLPAEAVRRFDSVGSTGTSIALELIC